MMSELHEVVHEVAVDLDASTEVVLDKVFVSQLDLVVHKVVHEVVHNVLV